MNDLFEKLKGENMFDAYLVIKNQLNSDIANKEVFEKFIDTGIILSGYDVEFDYRRQIVSEMQSALQMFAESTYIDEEILNFIKTTQGRISECFKKIDDDENTFMQNILHEKENANREILEKLMYVREKLEKSAKQKDFDDLLSSVSDIESQLDKDAFTPEQEKSYESLTKAFSKTISEKMEKLNRDELLEYNKEAVKQFKEVFDTFKNNKSEYKQRHNLKNLLTTKFFVYDTSKLFNETLIYYNNVYNMIFQEISDELKFAVTEWALSTAKAEV